MAVAQEKDEEYWRKVQSALWDCSRHQKGKKIVVPSLEYHDKRCDRKISKTRGSQNYQCLYSKI